MLVCRIFSSLPFTRCSNLLLIQFTEYKKTKVDIATSQPINATEQEIKSFSPRDEIAIHFISPQT